MRHLRYPCCYFTIMECYSVRSCDSEFWEFLLFNVRIFQGVLHFGEYYLVTCIGVWNAEERFPMAFKYYHLDRNYTSAFYTELFSPLLCDPTLCLWHIYVCTCPFFLKAKCPSCSLVNFIPILLHYVLNLISVSAVTIFVHFLLNFLR